MKLPIRRLPGVPPRFEYYTIVNMPGGGTQAIKSIGSVVPAMEAALCDLLKIAEQLAKENLVLKAK